MEKVKYGERLRSRYAAIAVVNILIEDGVLDDDFSLMPGLGIADVNAALVRADFAQWPFYESEYRLGLDIQIVKAMLSDTLDQQKECDISNRMDVLIIQLQPQSVQGIMDIRNATKDIIQIIKGGF
jgi:hypothetical protein